MYSPSAVVLCILLSVIPLRASASCKVENNTAICEGIIDVDDVKIERIVVRGIVEYIAKENFTKFENLKYIDLSNTGLREIENDAFILNEHLEELNLSLNQDLQVLPNETFITSKSLKHLNLSITSIEEITENFVSGLPNLEVIDLTDTAIKTYSSLSNLKKLKTLIITENKTLNKDSLCDEIHIREIIEIRINNDTRITHNCTQKPENTTVGQPTVNATKEEKTIEKTTEETAASTETTTITENLQTEVNTETSSENKPEQPEPVITAEKTESETDIAETTNHETTPDTLVVPPENMQSPENSLAPKEPEITDPQPPEIKTENTNETSQTEGSLERKLDTTGNSENQTKKSEKIVIGVGNSENSEMDRKATEAEAVQPSPSQSSGVNIVLGIILCVMVVGALGFGYKYWKKNRQGYRNANTEDVELGKELQDMRLCTEEQN